MKSINATALSNALTFAKTTPENDVARFYVELNIAPTSKLLQERFFETLKELEAKGNALHLAYFFTIVDVNKNDEFPREFIQKIDAEVGTTEDIKFIVHNKLQDVFNECAYESFEHFMNVTVMELPHNERAFITEGLRNIMEQHA